MPIHIYIKIHASAHIAALICLFGFKNSDPTSLRLQKFQFFGTFSKRYVFFVLENIRLSPAVLKKRTFHTRPKISFVFTTVPFFMTFYNLNNNAMRFNICMLCVARFCKTRLNAKTTLKNAKRNQPQALTF